MNAGDGCSSRRGDAGLEIVAYDPAWPALFETERILLASALAPWIVAPIEHIGSTAVPGLAAKPVIDIMAPVHTLAASCPALAAAAEVGYLHAPYKADEMHWFCKPSPSHRTHHLHLVPHGSPAWAQRLRWRNALRRDAALAAQYAALKRRLAQQHRTDREAYTQAKGPFIETTLARLDAGDAHRS